MFVAAAQKYWLKHVSLTTLLDVYSACFFFWIPLSLVIC